MVLLWHTCFLFCFLFSDVYQVHLPLIDVYLLMDTFFFLFKFCLCCNDIQCLFSFFLQYHLKWPLSSVRSLGIMDCGHYGWLLSYSWIQWEDKHFNFSCWFYILNLNEVMIVEWRYLWLWSIVTLDSVWVCSDHHVFL